MSLHGHKIDFDDALFNRPDHMKPPLVEGNFYLKATYICSECEYKEDVLINKDKEIYHECNQGNRRTLVPTLTIPAPKSANQKLLLRGHK